jgi:Zn-dependent protease
VLLHELAHALVARRSGIPILGIDLHFFGGAAKIAQMPGSPRLEILISLAGPFASFVLAALSYAVSLIAGGFFTTFAVINLVLGTFNLLPALPMDGGRVLRAALSYRLGRLKATIISVKVARGLAIALGLFALINFHFFLMGLAIMLWFMAGVELQAARFWQMNEQMRSGDWSQAEHVGEVEVLDRDGRPIHRARGQEAPMGSNRFVLRSPNGEFIFIFGQNPR